MQYTQYLFSSIIQQVQTILSTYQVLALQTGSRACTTGLPTEVLEGKEDIKSLTHTYMHTDSVCLHSSPASDNLLANFINFIFLSPSSS